MFHSAALRFNIFPNQAGAAKLPVGKMSYDFPSPALSFTLSPSPAPGGWAGGADGAGVAGAGRAGRAGGGQAAGGGGGEGPSLSPSLCPGPSLSLSLSLFSLFHSLSLSRAGRAGAAGGGRWPGGRLGRRGGRRGLCLSVSPSLSLPLSISPPILSSTTVLFFL